MSSPYYIAGNYIYECKSSPDKYYLSNLTLKSAISHLNQLLQECNQNGCQPSGFRYIFPVNHVDEEGKKRLEDLKNAFPNLDIRYYDCDSVDNIISVLKTVREATSLVDYIQKVRGK